MASQIIAACVEAYTAPGDLVAAPFCTSAAIVTEAQKTGRRAISVTFNPLDALRTRLALAPVPANRLDAAVTRLGDSPKHGTTMREHLQGLYRTTCPHCAGSAVMECALWEQGSPVPQQIEYRCAACEEAGARDGDEADVRAMSAVEPHGLHYWWVLDRVAKAEDRGRKLAASLLELYTPRNLYALANLARKIDDLFADSVVHDALRLALLQCLELGSKLNLPAHDEWSPREAQRLRPPPRFVEHNVWLLFEEALHQLVRIPHQPPVHLAPSISDVLAMSPGGEAVTPTSSAGAYVGHMSIRQLTRQLPDASVSLIWTRPPRLGREHWALPYLWTGWLYGHEAAAPLWRLVRRRSPDWPWYLQAMRSTLLAVKRALALDGHMTLIGQTRGLPYHEAICLATAATDLYLDNVVCQPLGGESDSIPDAQAQVDYQGTWSVGAAAPPWPMPLEALEEKIRQVAVETAQEVLSQRAEPSSFARLHCHIWEALAQQGLLQRVMSIDELPGPQGVVQEHVQAALQGAVPHTLIRIDEREEGSGWWWLAQPPETPPLSERVERTVCEILESVDRIGLAEFLVGLYARFPGALTPDTEWTLACLRAYAQQTNSATWVQHAADRREQRAQEREESQSLLQEMGVRLGLESLQSIQGVDVQWGVGANDSIAFAVLDSAALSRLLKFADPGSASRVRRIALVAEGRQELIQLRLSRSGWLRRRLAERGWQFIKDANLRDWAVQKAVSPADLDSFVGMDLLSAEDRTQLSLI